MAFTFVPLFSPQQLGTGAATITTVPSSPSTTFLTGGVVKLANTTAGAVTATLYAVPNAGSPTDTNTFFPTTSIPANTSLDVTVPQIGAGGTIQGKAGAATSISITPVSGAYYS